MTCLKKKNSTDLTTNSKGEGERPLFFVFSNYLLEIIRLMENKINSFNTLRQVEEYRKAVNEACDSRAKYIKSCMKAYELGDKPFGYLKECFEALSENLYNSKEGKKLIGRYVSLIKENKDLSRLHSLYEGIRKMNGNSDIEYFINSLTEAAGCCGKNYRDSVKKLGSIISEAVIMLGEEADTLIPKENSSLYNAVEFLAESKKNIGNIAKYSHAVKIIRENISKNSNDKNIFETSSIADAEKLIDEFNEKYNGKLSEEEMEMVQNASAGEDKETAFNQCKENCLKKLKEAKKSCNETDSARMERVIAKVDGKQFCNETVDSDICNLLEISKIF